MVRGWQLVIRIWKRGSSGLDRRVARTAEKIAAIVCPNNLKAMWNAIHVEIPRIFVCCRKLGFAHLSAIRTSKNFNPTVAGHLIYGDAIIFVPTWAMPQSICGGTFLPFRA